MDLDWQASMVESQEVWDVHFFDEACAEIKRYAVEKWNLVDSLEGCLRFQARYYKK